MQVISVSYRTDIPTFYGEWFMRRVREGYARYPNPYSPQIVSVSLKPEDVHAFAFWSKNYLPFVKHLDELDARGYDFYFHYSITGLPRILEEKVPDWATCVQNFVELSRRYSPKHVQWRYDPIVFSNITPFEFHVETFRRMAQRLEGSTERCYISFLDIYRKARRNLQSVEAILSVEDPEQEHKIELALRLAEIASVYGITLYTCVEDFAAIGPIKRGACVDKDILDQLWPHKARKMALSNNRNRCGCYESRDIGIYDTCPHGCIYCYAVLNRALALKRFAKHDPTADCLVDIGGDVPPDVKDTNQLSLF